MLENEINETFSCREFAKAPAKDEMGRKNKKAGSSRAWRGARPLTLGELRRPAYAQRTGSRSPGSRWRTWVFELVAVF